MLESLDRLMLAGLGALSMTREKAEKIFDEYVKAGKAAKDSRAGFVKELVDSADKARAEMEKTIAEQLRQALAKLNLPTRDDLARLEAKIDAIKGRK